MKDAPTTTCGPRDVGDRLTHIERINEPDPTISPADGRGAGGVYYRTAR